MAGVPVLALVSMLVAHTHVLGPPSHYYDNDIMTPPATMRTQGVGENQILGR